MQEVAFPQLRPSTNQKWDFQGSYRGVILQRNDPMRLYRLKVWIPGIHADNATAADLPWSWPCASLTHQSGFMGVPPLNTWVWVEFQKGNHEHPIWTGSAWGNETNIKGTGNNAHVFWPTNAFGGSGHPNGLLKLDKDTDPSTAPDNFGFVSPLQKRLELDDRYGRQRLLLADGKDNFNWLNTEHGVHTTHVHAGLQHSQSRARGLTISADPDVNTTQIYSYDGWRMTFNSNDGLCEISSPTGHQIRIIDTDEDQSIKAWTPGGHKVSLDDKGQKIQLQSADAFGVILDDKGQKTALYTKDLSQYLLLDKANNTSEVFSLGEVKLISGSNIVLEAQSSLYLRANLKIAFDDQNPAALVRNSAMGDVVNQEEKPEVQEQILRACDYDYYKSHEKNG